MKKSYADMDPLEEIRAIKEEISREFPTAKALGEYLRKKYPSANTPMQSPCKVARVEMKPVKSGIPKTAKKSSVSRKTAKRLTHA